MLGVQVVGFDRIYAHRLEGSRADVQRYFRHQGAASLDRLERRALEVQPRGRGRHCPRLCGVDGLVALLVRLPRRVLDIGRQRNGAAAF